MAKLKRKVEIKTVAVGSQTVPIITVSDVPATVEVGEKITPKVKVEKAVADPVENVSVDFYTEDSLITTNLGTRQLTDVNGEATADESYYVPTAEEGLSVKIVIVVNAKKLV